MKKRKWCTMTFQQKILQETCVGKNQAWNPMDSEILMTWLIQQSLPKMQAPKFDGHPIKWVDFIVKFKELVHGQAYLNSDHKFIYLMQYIEREAKRSLGVLSRNKEGYMAALK